MDSNNSLLNHLRSTDKDTRLRACKSLLHAPRLSHEAAYALQLAVLDSDQHVARYARFTLLVHQFKLKKIAITLAWIVGVGIGIAVLWLIFSDLFTTSILTCEREKPGAAVNCLEQPYYFDYVRLPERKIRDVRSVEILVMTSDDDADLYKLALVTNDGKVELDAGYSYNYRLKHQMADQIEDLIKSDTKGEVVIRDPGFLTWSSALVLAGPALIFLVFIGLSKGVSTFWRRIKPKRSQAKRSRQSAKPAGIYTRLASDEPRVYLQKKWGTPHTKSGTTFDAGQQKCDEPGKLTRNEIKKHDVANGF